jgi:hypothetical protein
MSQDTVQEQALLKTALSASMPQKGKELNDMSKNQVLKDSGLCSIGLVCISMLGIHRRKEGHISRLRKDGMRVQVTAINGTDMSKDETFSNPNISF